MQECARADRAAAARQRRLAAGCAANRPPRPALFDSRQLDDFGTGRLSDCLGPAFAKYDDRRIPRIPNGDLKMMSRIVAIAGRVAIYDPPASIDAEYDVPLDAWYLRDSASGEIPYALWMEIALQPCGFLSAYLDTYALVPHGEFYFRNLDGSLRLVETDGCARQDHHYPGPAALPRGQRRDGHPEIWL